MEKTISAMTTGKKKKAGGVREALRRLHGKGGFLRAGLRSPLGAPQNPTDARSCIPMLFKPGHNAQGRARLGAFGGIREATGI